MELVIGNKYYHSTSSGVNELVYSHSDKLDHNHVFTVTKNRKNWKLDGNGQITLPTWDLQRNVRCKTKMFELKFERRDLNGKPHIEREIQPILSFNDCK